MAAIKEKDLKKIIRSGNVTGLFLIYGNENYLKTHYVEQMKKKAVDSALEDFNLHCFEGKEISIDEIHEAIEAMPVMSETNCVIVDDLPMDKLASAEQSKLFEMISDVPETCCLIFKVSETDVSPKKSAKWKSIIKEFENHGNAVELNHLTTEEVKKIIISGIEKRGCKISSRSASLLIENAGSDLTSLFNEVEKLSAYASGREITPEDINLLVSKTVETTVFAMTRSLLSGRIDAAYNSLNELFYQKTDPIMIMGALISTYVDIYRVKAAKISGVRIESIGEYYNYRGKEFKLKNSGQNASALSLTQIRKSIDALSEADFQVKFSRIDPKIVLEKALIKLALIANNQTI